MSGCLPFGRPDSPTDSTDSSQALAPHNCRRAFITHIGKYLPGNPVSNDEMEAYLGMVGDRPSRVRRRILKNNGIQQRYYAINRQQQTTISNSQMAAAAVRDVLTQAGLPPKDIDLLTCGTTWPDLLVPGFASMVHGELPELAPIEATSHQGVCCAGVAALKYATSQVQLGTKRRAIAVASELASRLFKHTRFEAETGIQVGDTLPFDTEFLRWMLSDGAGAVLVSDRPSPTGLSLRVEWIELISHANAYPVCMYAGTNGPGTNGPGTNGPGTNGPDRLTSWMDYASQMEAAQDGLINLRQNIRLLDQVIHLGVEGWLRLIDQGRIQPDAVDWFLCHYSSHFFRSQIVELLEKAGAMVPEEKWFTNLYTRGNTGCASIYLMLEELFHSGKLQPGQQVFCFVPESGRFTTAYMMLRVVEPSRDLGSSLHESTPEPQLLQEPGNLPPKNVLLPKDNDVKDTSSMAESAAKANPKLPGTVTADSVAMTDNSPLGNSSLGNSSSDNSSSSNSSAVSEELLRQLMRVWLKFQRELQSVPIIQRLNSGAFTLEDYQALLRNLRPQVVEGARWIARAASYATDFSLRSLLIGHAQDEHRDFQMLERNYVSVGGKLADIVNAEKNIGSEALSAFIFHQASQDNPIDLLGSIFIIEGLGNRMAGQWADQIRSTLNLEPQQVSFLGYHAANDESHIGKLDEFIYAEWMTPDIARRIVKTAKVTARLYRLQLEEITS